MSRTLVWREWSGYQERKCYVPSDQKVLVVSWWSDSHKLKYIITYLLGLLLKITSSFRSYRRESCFLAGRSDRPWQQQVRLGVVLVVRGPQNSLVVHTSETTKTRDSTESYCYESFKSSIGENDKGRYNESLSCHSCVPLTLGQLGRGDVGYSIPCSSNTQLRRVECTQFCFFFQTPFSGHCIVLFSHS